MGVSEIFAQKAVILCNPRSGSHLLTKALEQNSDLRVLGEAIPHRGELIPDAAMATMRYLFGFENPRAMEFPQGSENLKQVAIPGYMLALLQQHCDVLTLLYTQMPDNRLIHALRYWKIKVLHLTRHNLMEIYVSYRTAEQNDVWHVEEEKDLVRTDLVEFDYLEFEHLIANYWSAHATIESILFEHRLEVSYDDLCNNWDVKTKQIQKFLGVKPQVLPQLTIKLNPEPLKKIANLCGVRNHYFNTPHSKYFFRFTVDWFTNHVPVWQEILKPYGGKKVRYLEIGAYEGRSVTWMLHNIMTSAEAEITIIEPGYSLGNNNNLHYNLYGYPQKIKVIEDFSSKLAEPGTLGLTTEPYQIIYVDGDHRETAAYTDGCNAFKLLAPGGVMCFDDYKMPVNAPDGTHPRDGIDKFLKEHASELDVISQTYQIWIRKKY